MLESLDLYKQVSSKPAQLQQKRSIIGGKSVEYFEFGIAGELIPTIQAANVAGKK